MPRGTPNAKPAAAKLTATPLKTEFYNFAGTLPADTAYERLEPLLAEAGWFYRLVEIDAVPCYDGSMLMRYEVNIGRTTEAGGYEFEAVDAASMKMPGQPGPVSVAARIALRETVLYLLTGRLPLPKTVSQPTTGSTFTKYPEGTQGTNGLGEKIVGMNDHDVEIDQELVDDSPAVSVVERREPDGLPIFMDLYALGSPSKDVVNAVLDEVSQFLETATLEQITALGAKNADMMKFIKDLGTDEDVAELKAMIGKRREALTLPPQGAAMRRRAAAAAN